MNTTKEMSTIKALPENTFVVEAQERFLLEFEVCDWTELLQHIGISRFRPLKYSRTLGACKAVYIMLWYHALLRSFPVYAFMMLEQFLIEGLSRSYSHRALTKMETQVRHILELMKEKGDGDFMIPARYLLETAGKAKGKNLLAKQMKIVLHLRSQYDFLFNHLI